MSLNIEEQLMDINGKIERHMGVAEGFMSSQKEINDKLTTCVETLSRKQGAFSSDLGKIRQKVGLIVLSITSGLTLIWHVVLKKFGLD